MSASRRSQLRSRKSGQLDRVGCSILVFCVEIDLFHPSRKQLILHVNNPLTYMFQNATSEIYGNS